MDFGLPTEPTFFTLQVKDSMCIRCGAHYAAHGAGLQCPSWAFERKAMELEEQVKQLQELAASAKEREK